MDCKKALDEAGTVEGALEILRKKGINTVAREGRVACDGALAISVAGSRGAMVELNSETDFVSRLPDFQSLVQAIADHARTLPLPADQLPLTTDHLLATSLPSTTASAGQSTTVRETIAQLMYKTGEKVELKRVCRLQEGEGQADGEGQAGGQVVVQGYVHPGAKHASLVALKVHKTTGGAEGEQLASKDVEQLARHLAIQITGFKPKYLSRVDLSEDQTQAALQAASGGESPFLLEQTFYIEDPDGNTTVQAALAKYAKRHGLDLSISSFAQWSLGVYPSASS